jgi:hypothetical protein
MADYPSGTYSPRTKENKSGVDYDSTKKKVIFAEDISKLDDEVVAIETELGTIPKGSFGSVKLLLEWLQEIIYLVEYIPNAVFDWWEAGSPSYWAASNATLVEYKDDGTDNLVGGKAVKITGTAQYGGLFNNLTSAEHHTLLNGKTYLVKYRYKVSGTGGSPRINIQLNEDPWTSFGSKSLSSTDWVEDSFEITVAAGSGHDSGKTVSVAIDFIGASGWADIYIDWIVITKEDPPAFTTPPPFYKALYKE